jgi:GT2 family glycosyltransferase
MTETRRCLIVVVLYRMLAQDSITVQGIAHALRDDARLRDTYDVLLWDNTPGDHGSSVETGPDAEFGFQYCKALVNDGVAGAFNAAMHICMNNRYEWMMLLDQDTVVTGGYLEGMSRYQQALRAVDVAAIVPLLLDRDFQISPKRVLRFRDQPIVTRRCQILSGEVFAANSGVVMSVSALRAIGGYSRDFWLDHSDMYVFHQFYLQGRKIYFAADLSLQHSMTMLDYDGSMSPGRYENFLYAEQAFIDLYKNRAENAMHVLRMLMRAIRQRRRHRDHTYSKMTFAFLLWRLRTSKTRRLAAWKLRAIDRQRLAETAGSQAAR